MCQKNDESSCICPMCHTDYAVDSYWTLFLTISDWPATLIFAVIVNAMGRFLGLAPGITFFFCILAISPLCFRIVAKNTCTRCGIDFEKEQPHPELQRHS